MLVLRDARITEVVTTKTAKNIHFQIFRHPSEVRVSRHNRQLCCRHYTSSRSIPGAWYHRVLCIQVALSLRLIIRRLKAAACRLSVAFVAGKTLKKGIIRIKIVVAMSEDSAKQTKNSFQKQHRTSRHSTKKTDAPRLIPHRAINPRNPGITRRLLYTAAAIAIPGVSMQVLVQIFCAQRLCLGTLRHDGRPRCELIHLRFGLDDAHRALTRPCGPSPTNVWLLFLNDVAHLA